MLRLSTFKGEFLAGDDHRRFMSVPKGRKRPMVALKILVLGIEARGEVGLGAGHSPIVAEAMCGSRARARFDRPTCFCRSGTPSGAA